MTSQSRIGVFGGSFNPIHLGHLILAENAREQLRLDEVVFAPAGSPPHKDGAALERVEHRLAMVQLAVAGNDQFRCSDIDSRGDHPAYTWQLLERFRDEHPGAALWFLIGGDSLADFHRWSRPARILHLARLAVANRPDVETNERQLSTVPDLTDHVDVIEAPLCAISATDIRERLATGLSIRYLVPDSVRTYIDDHDLYRSGTGDQASPKLG